MGTTILTDRGEAPTGTLVIGDRVMTAASRAEPIRWLGRRTYAGPFLAGRLHLLPVVIRAGALGDGVPHRDLRVSPSQAMFLDGLLVPAGELVNGNTIVQDQHCQTVEYIHIELAERDVILAEGAASETFMDDHSRTMFHNAAAYAAHYPSAPEPTGFCAPRVTEGYPLEAIRQRLALAARTLDEAA